MAAPTYDPYLQFNPTFRYGGRSWGANDMDAFKKVLRRRGVNYNQWARNHANAAKVFDPVEQQVYGTVKPQLDAINYERQKAEAAARRRMGDLAGFTQAIMGMLGEISPAVRGAYGEGSETMRAGGTGFGDVLNTNMAANAAQGNTLLDVLGAPEGQKLQGGDAGSVLAGVAGWLPADMMAKQGEAYGKMFAEMPKEASFQAQLEMKKLLADAAQTDDDFSQEIMGVLGGLPNIREELKQQRIAQNLDKQKMRLAQLEEEHDYYMKQQALLLSQGRYKLAKEAGARAERAQRRYEYESQGRDYEGNLKPGYAEAPNGTVYNMKDFHVDKKGNLVKNKSGSSGGLTPTQKAAQIEAIQGKEEDIKDMVLKGIQSGVWMPSSGRPQDRAKLGRQIFEHYKHLASTPAAKKALRALIAKVLNDAGRIGPPAPGQTGSGSDGFWDS